VHENRKPSVQVQGERRHGDAHLSRVRITQLSRPAGRPGGRAADLARQSGQCHFASWVVVSARARWIRVLIKMDVFWCTGLSKSVIFKIIYLD
jgi:hypothetical protein